MKRLLNKWILIMGVIALGTTTGNASGWFGITKTPVIEGRLIDAKTGKPVKDAIIIARWDAQYLGLSVDMISGFYKGETVISDADGKFRIPADKHLRLGSRFSFIDIAIRHPLYETLGARWPGIGEINMNGNVIWEVQMSDLNGRLNSDLDYWKYYLVARKCGIDVSKVISDTAFKKLLEHDQHIKNVYNRDLRKIDKWKEIYD